MALTNETIKGHLISKGIQNCHEFGYEHVDSNNILTDMVYSAFFKSMLKDNLGQSTDQIDEVITALIAEITTNEKAQEAKASEVKILEIMISNDVRHLQYFTLNKEIAKTQFFESTVDGLRPLGQVKRYAEKHGYTRIHLISITLRKQDVEYIFANGKWTIDK